MRSEDVFACAPIGSGKTFYFAFLSALLFEKEGHQVVSVVVSPLSSLMLDQVERLKTLNIDAAFVGEQQKDHLVKEKVIAGDVDMLFITLNAVSESVWRRVCQGLLSPTKSKLLSLMRHTVFLIGKM